MKERLCAGAPLAEAFLKKITIFPEYGSTFFLLTCINHFLFPSTSWLTSGNCFLHPFWRWKHTALLFVYFSPWSWLLMLTEFISIPCLIPFIQSYIVLVLLFFYTSPPSLSQHLNLSLIFICSHSFCCVVLKFYYFTTRFTNSHLLYSRNY